MNVHNRFGFFCGSLGLIAVPLVSTAADAADQTADEKPAVAYRAESPNESFTSNASNVVMETRADGTRIYHMNGEGMQSITARIGADGKLRVECTDAADKTLDAASPAGNADEK